MIISYINVYIYTYNLSHRSYNPIWPLSAITVGFPTSNRQRMARWNATALAQLWGIPSRPTTDLSVEKSRSAAWSHGSGIIRERDLFLDFFLSFKSSSAESDSGEWCCTTATHRLVLWGPHCRRAVRSRCCCWLARPTSGAPCQLVASNLDP